MVKKTQNGMTQSPSLGQWLLCLLVAITFLYNPFLATASVLGEPSVGHLPSFRATVASLELLKFKPEEMKGAATVPSSDVPVPVHNSQVYVESTYGQCDASECVPRQLFLSGNLFFRPPPAA